jgi:hypothetical protein
VQLFVKRADVVKTNKFGPINRSGINTVYSKYSMPQKVSA